MALEVSGRTGSAVDAKMFEAWLDVDIFSIYPRKWNVEETVYREHDCTEELTASCKSLCSCLNCSSVFKQYTICTS